MAARSKSKDTSAQHKHHGFSPLNALSRTLHGQIISSDFFARNWLTILVGVIVLMVYITNKYNCQTSMEEIKRLEQKLEVARTEAMRERAEYMTKLTERAMQSRLDSLGLPLRVQDQPPFKLSIDKK